MGRLWRGHADLCPGWKELMRSLPDEEKRAYVERHNFPADTFA
jgi:hypothetical protein